MKIFGISLMTETKYALSEANNKKLSEKLVSAQAELGLANSKIDKLESERNSSLKKNEVAKKLIGQEEEIKKERLGRLFSLGALYRAVYGIKIKSGEEEFSRRSKIGKRIEFSDKDDKSPFIFGDINISEKGFFVITDKDKNIKGQFPLPPGMFAKPSSLLTQIRRGRILMGIDENGDIVPDFDDIEINLPVWNETLQEYEESEVLRVKARNKIIELQDEIRDKEETIEKHESIIDGAKNDIRDFKRKVERYVSEIRILNSDMSRLSGEYQEMKSRTSFMQSRILELQEVAAMKEDLAKKFEVCLTEALNKIEDVAGKTAKEKATAELKDVMNMLQVLQLQKKLDVKNPVIVGRT